MRWTVLLVLGLIGCSEPIPVAGFAGTTPAIDPVRFFTGHVRSWGVLEDRGGQPTQVVVTDCRGEADGDTLRMTQTLTIGSDAPVTRTWQMRRAGPGRFEATANDMVGTAVGEASGRVFHWTWTLATSPGNDLKNVTMDQWWYLLDDGTMLNRTTIRKAGIILAQVSEHFAPVR
ncbi:MAG: DUF3833 family protein [Gemmatimonadaceae bacterium]|nr:DUF3833 family protein [Acetobacteraceae bacterium]